MKRQISIAYTTLAIILAALITGGMLYSSHSNSPASSHIGVTAGNARPAQHPASRNRPSGRSLPSTMAGKPSGRYVPGAIDAEIFNSFTPPAGRYRDQMDSLRAAAESGDKPSEYALSRLLLDCYFVQKGQPSALGSDAPDRCEGISVTDPKEAMTLLTSAADGGYAPAQLLYPTVLPVLMTPTDMIRDPSSVQDFKDRSLSYLTSLANRGSGTAMAELARAYARGIMTDKNMEMAYAYQYSAIMINPSASDDPADAFAGNLSPAQIANAKKMAESLFHRCCG